MILEWFCDTTKDVIPISVIYLSSFLFVSCNTKICYDPLMLPSPSDTIRLFNVTLSLDASLSEDEVQIVAAFMDDVAESLAVVRAANHHKGAWKIECYTHENPGREHWAARVALIENQTGVLVRDWAVVEVDTSIDWLAHSYQQFPAFTVGNFYVYGSHCEDESGEGQIALQIDAATAFGSGEHPTTKGCLLLLERLKDQGFAPQNILDMGTGSGILAIAAHKLWPEDRRILAVDIDEEAVNVTKRHAEYNGVQTGLKSVCGDGFAHGLVQSRKPFDLIIANILAGPLKEMVGDLVAVLGDGGQVILSGIIDEQADSVLAAYQGAGLTLRDRIDEKEWVSLLFGF